MVQTATLSPVDGVAADERRREILAAASAVFRRRGFAATGMREIAAELGMTAGNLYYYFRGKDHLLAYCQEVTLDALLDGVEAIRADGGSSTLQLRRAIVAHVVCLNETLPGSLAHLEVEALPAEIRAPVVRKRKRYEELLGELVAAGVASGELAAADSRLAVRALLGTLNWTVKWFQPGRGDSARQVGEKLADLFLHGLEERSR